MADGLKILKQLNEIENKFRNQTNKNILIKHGLTEQITEFQKPIVESLKQLEQNQPKEFESTQMKELSIKEKFNKVFDIEIDSNLKNLTKSVTPKLRFEDNTQKMVLNNKVIPVKVDENKRFLTLPTGEDIEMNAEVISLLLGDNFSNNHSINNLTEYHKILKSTGVTNRTPRFASLSNLITKGEGIPIDLTDKSPIDLFIELNKLISAKKAGNNNSLGRASIIIDKLKKLNLIDDKKHRKLLNIFSS